MKWDMVEHVVRKPADASGNQNHPRHEASIWGDPSSPEIQASKNGEEEEFSLATFKARFGNNRQWSAGWPPNSLG
jgi:hypothetical protein